MNISKNKGSNVKIAVFVVIVVALIVIAALCGYHLTSRYNDTISDFYYNVVNGLSGQVSDIEDEIKNKAETVPNNDKFD